jgi:hypothetical protein
MVKLTKYLRHQDISGGELESDAKFGSEWISILKTEQVTKQKLDH